MSDVILTLSGNLHLAPSNIMLSAIEQQLSGVDGREDRLREALEEVAPRYDDCIIDSPPNVGLLTFNALRAADQVLVPVETGFFSMHGVAKLLETVAVVNSEYGQDTPVQVLPTMYEARHRIDREVLAGMRSRFSSRLTQTVIRTNVRLREAASFGLPITEFAPKSLGAADYLALAIELVQAEEARDASDVAAAVAPEDAILIGSADVPVDTGEVPEPWTVIHPEPADGPAPEEPVAEGMVVAFTCHAPGADVVQVAGDFNNWSPEALHPSDAAEGQWKRLIRLRTGRYRYRFVVDNTWRQDPNNPDIEDCPFGGHNSVLTVA